MFARMQLRLPLVGAPSDRPAVAVSPVFESSGLGELFTELGGAIFAEGAYRIHDPALAPKWTDLAVAAFPDLSGEIFCFASDWLGRQFAVSTEPAPTGRLGVVLVDVQTDDVLHTDRDLQDFHDGLLADDPEPALALTLFGEWCAAGGSVPSASQCVAFTIPVYLGGADDFANMSITDMEVAWDIGGQLLRQIRGIPDGTPIADINIVWPGR